MAENQDQLNALLEKVNALMKRQEAFSQEIDSLRNEVLKLRGDDPSEADSAQIATEPNFTNSKINHRNPPIIQTTKPSSSEIKSSRSKVKSPKLKTDLEKFVGENLINKIGIAITVIGISIGAKYSIDHNLISPLTRIILSYLFGLSLLGLGLNLKKNYDGYSAVLVSGAMAILYFVTYAAYAIFGLLPQIPAFVLMLIFTVFTVGAALKYNRQVIAHIGLVGAYAVPFLLSEGSGKVEILFAYIAIINIGILAISFRKYWKPLYYFSFVLTWLIFSAWSVSQFDDAKHFYLALGFQTAYFVIFYLTFLAYKLVKKEHFQTSDILLLLANSFVFYGLGYNLISEHNSDSQFLGLFTFANAITHLIAALIIYQRKLADKNIFYLVSGLMMVFITITIPIQLDGDWVTLLWAGEAALLFWIGRTKSAPIYERLSFPLMGLAFGSLLQDWVGFYGNGIVTAQPFLNIHFLTSLLFIIFLWFINVVNHKSSNATPYNSSVGIGKLISLSIPAILIIVLYNSLRLEISLYWDQLYQASGVDTILGDSDYTSTFFDYDLPRFKSVWLIIYSLFFCSLLTLVNNQKIRNQQLGVVAFWLTAFSILVFLSYGLYQLSELRESYLQQSYSEYYTRTWFNLGIRYISIAFTGLALALSYQFSYKLAASQKLKVWFDFLLHITALWFLSSELINWMDFAGNNQSYKLGLSILSGIYALFIIALGIIKGKKHLRIGAIVLFAITLIKLFAYDIADMETIAKTVVMVTLGVLLLIISFLYNKYKHLI
ncbi:DUF2339 domain-containing protein [Owenweeksia hongkongensis]|uniref:DUF2339 domain-containing protein n=1 Tax=Owenweeksia hongkongensis TaxID=253245 RepID=UPI003A957F79